MPVAHDPISRIINVHWEEGGLAFLYSGADGMFGSQDGTEWVKAKSPVPATSLAFVDDVWMACGPDGCWRSEDGAVTWQAASAPGFFEVVAMKPKSLSPEDQPKPGVFAGWTEDDAGDNHIVYTSRDGGLTWNVALTIPTSFGDSGSETIRGLSGCGGALFVCTNYHSEIFHAGDGKIYSSSDGQTFSPQTVFGPGSIILPTDPDQFPRVSFTANAVGYDAQTKQYIAIGDKEIVLNAGGQESYLIYTLSGSTSFGSGDGTIAESARQVSGAGKPGGDFISTASTAAGGAGTHVAGFSYFQNRNDGSFISGALKSRFIPGAAGVLQPMSSRGGGFIGSLCFRSDSETNTEGSTDEPDGSGTFACVAFDADKVGGAFIASSAASGFTKTHSGTGIGSQGRGAVAVGTVGFLEGTDAGL